MDDGTRLSPISAENAAAFAVEVKERVNRHFSDRGLSKHANAAMMAKSVILIGGYFGAYGSILGGALPLWLMWPMCVVMGICMAGIGFSVTHDALHGAYSARPGVNRCLGYLFETLGANGYMWKITHNLIHHTYTNIQGVDEDLEVADYIRLSPHTPYRPIHRLQKYFAFPSYAFSTVFWVFAKDYKYFLKRDLYSRRIEGHPAAEWRILLISKFLYYMATIAAPLAILDVTWWQFAIGFLTVHCTAGLILGMIFQLAHVVEPTRHFRKGQIEYVKRTWMHQQMATCNDFAPGNRLLTWYVGGLNFQVEHHLFPKICHVHYRKLAPIVRQVALKHGLPYNQDASLWRAIRSHYRTLEKFGDPAYVPA